jgi:hypothetical protein
MRSLSKYSPERIDIRIVWWLITIVLIIPLLVPVNIPVIVQPSTLKVYNYLDKVPSGSVIVFGFACSAGCWPELDPSAQAVLRQLMSRGAKVVMVGFTLPDSGVLAEGLIREADQNGIFARKTYGVDYVNLGFIPGGEIPLATMISNFKDVARADFRGTPAESLPLLTGIRDYRDLYCAIFFDGGGAYLPWVRQWVPVAKKPLIDIPQAAAAVDAQPYYSSGQLFGLMPGLRGGAEYEQLLGYHAFATKSMDMISAGHLAFIGLMIVGNVYYFNSKRSKK